MWGPAVGPLAPLMLMTVFIRSGMRTFAQAMAEIDRLMRPQPRNPYESYTPVNGFPVPSHEAAYERARQLFLASLTPEQRECWHSRHHIQFVGSDKAVYFLWGQSSYNVLRVTQWDAQVLCAVLKPELGCPSYDNYLAQKLCIEANAPHFCRVAFSQWMSLPAAVERFTAFSILTAAEESARLAQTSS